MLEWIALCGCPKTPAKSSDGFPIERDLLYGHSGIFV
jgi:hypothetical protein